jgi:hypothetical protein
VRWDLAWRFFSGTRGARFPAEFGSADLRNSNQASHLSRDERSFSAEVGSAQTPRTRLTISQFSIEMGISEQG